MKRLISIAAVLALTAARPEMYKEAEDFQYSRSSSDDGAKSGFYGAQRGNMGGNYERSHNMDGLAQHQMSGAVKQVEGELGDAANTRTGSVFTAANSRGMYGSGHYDLSNLHGRNFQEGVHSNGGSQSHASLSSQHGYHGHQSASSLQSSEYNSDAHRSAYNGYHGSNNYGRSLQSGNLQAEQNAQDSGYGQAISHNSGHQSHSGYHSQGAYESSSNTNQHSSHSGYVAQPQSRLIVATPVRIVGRPGQRVAIPLGVQTYDASHSASTLDQNAIDISEAEVLGNVDSVTYIPTNNAKRYESSYSYRKQWEKHDVKPEVIALSVPTENPIPKQSELYDDTQVSHNNYHAHGHNSHSGYSNTQHSDSHVKSSTAAQQYQYGAGSSHSNLASSEINSDAHTHGAYSSGNSADTINSIGDSDTKPKGYQSSYSYRKSWERQGDPYVIKPLDGSYVGQASQRLSAASHNHLSHEGVLENCDCDENGHVRVTRSYDNQYSQIQQQVQQSARDGPQISSGRVKKWYNFEVPEQKTQQNLHNHDEEPIGLNHYEQNQQQTEQAWENLEDLGQQVQKSGWTGSQARDKQTQLSGETGKKWYNFVDSEQETQQASHNHDFKPHSSNQYEQHQQQTQKSADNLEESGQQVQQSGWAGLQTGGDEIQSQQKWYNIENVEEERNKPVLNRFHQKPKSSWYAQKYLRQQDSNTWTSKENAVDGNILRQQLLNDQLGPNSGDVQKRRPVWRNSIPGRLTVTPHGVQVLSSPFHKTNIEIFFPENDFKKNHMEQNITDTHRLGQTYQSIDEHNDPNNTINTMYDVVVSPEKYIDPELADHHYQFQHDFISVKEKNDKKYGPLVNVADINNLEESIIDEHTLNHKKQEKHNELHNNKKHKLITYQQKYYKSYNNQQKSHKNNYRNPHRI